MVVVAQTPEVVERDHLQVWPGESIRQLLAHGFEDADSRGLLDALGKRFLLAMGKFLRRGLVAGHAVVNLAFLGLTEMRNAAGFNIFRRFRLTHLEKSDCPEPLKHFWSGHAPKQGERALRET